MDLERAKALAREAAEDNPQYVKRAEAIPPVTVPGRICHIDGDYLCYFAAGGGEMPPGIARQTAKDRIEKFRVLTGSERAIVHLSSRDCTKGERFFIAKETPYQGQRTGKKPGNWAVVREFLENYDGKLFTVKIWKTREADDGAAYCCEASGGRDACASRDKDWRMFSAIHIDWVTFQICEVPPGTYHIVGDNGEDYGHYFFWFQMLAGDTADHIPGLYGTGKVDAREILAGCNSNADAFATVVSRYREQRPDDWQDYFVEQAALLWMRTGRLAEISDFTSIIPDGNEWVAQSVARLTSRVEREKAELQEILDAIALRRAQTEGTVRQNYEER